MTIPILLFIRLLQIYFNYAAYAKARPREEKKCIDAYKYPFLFFSNYHEREKK
jgi:hypothetical protein